MQEIIWRDGEKFQKTKKEDKPIVNKNNEIIDTTVFKLYRIS